MSNRNHPPKWVNVYPQGTKEGDEEQKFFIALARHVKYVWRSTSALAKESGLTPERVDERIMKYYNKGMVFQNPKNEDQWGYWERCPSEFYDNSRSSIAKSDQNDRIDSVAFSSTGHDINTAGFAPAPSEIPRELVKYSVRRYC